MSTEYFDAFAQPQDQAPTHAEEPKEEKAPPKRKPARRRARRTTVKPKDAALKALTLYRDMQDSTDEELTMMSTVLNCNEELDEIVATLAAGGKGDTAFIESIVEIAETDNPFEAGVLAHALTEKKAVFNKAWGVVAQHATDLPKDPPRGSADAALKFAAAVAELSEDDMRSIRRPVELLGR